MMQGTPTTAAEARGARLAEKLHVVTNMAGDLAGLAFADGDTAARVEGVDRAEQRAIAERLALSWNTRPELVAALAEVIYAYDVVDARDDESGYQLQMSMESVMEQVRDAHYAANEVPA